MNSNLVTRSESTAAAGETLEVAGAGRQLLSGTKPTLRNQRAAAEIHAISTALLETGWNRKRAAQLLSISYRGLLYKIRQHNITPEFVDQLVSVAQKK
jgi:DNA-binding NtrC family response regulator